MTILPNTNIEKIIMTKQVYIITILLIFVVEKLNFY